MKDKLNHLLDSVYELEGLVHLALTRDDAPDALLSLIARKGREVASAATALDDDTPFVSTETGYDMANVASPDTDRSDTETQYDEILDTVLDPVEAPEMYDLPTGNETGEALAIDEIPTLSVETEETSSARESGTFSDSEEEASADDDFTPAKGNGPLGRLVFSINDRYRFRRELFNNSDADFNTSLSVVATMDSYDEAEDYFLNDLRLDPAAEVVTEFLDVVKKYFKE